MNVFTEKVLGIFKYPFGGIMIYKRFYCAALILISLIFCQPARAGDDIAKASSGKRATDANDPGAVEEDKEALKVISWNILYSFNHGESTERGIKWIKSQSPDVLALQELKGTKARGLQEKAQQWGHKHSVILKERGFPVGLTSKEPIEVIEKRVEGFHHGYLHCKTYGIHFFVVHFWRTKPNESRIILDKIKLLLESGEKVIVLGDFNNRSRRDRGADDKEERPGAYQVVDRFEAAGFVDTTHKHDKKALYSFGSPILIPEWVKTMEELKAKQKRIDFIFADKELSKYSVSGTIMHSEELDMISDHYPIVIRFKLPRRN